MLKSLVELVLNLQELGLFLLLQGKFVVLDVSTHLFGELL